MTRGKAAREGWSLLGRAGGGSWWTVFSLPACSRRCHRCRFARSLPESLLRAKQVRRAGSRRSRASAFFVVVVRDGLPRFRRRVPAPGRRSLSLLVFVAGVSAGETVPGHWPKPWAMDGLDLRG